jgi:hypothetical protein
LNKLFELKGGGEKPDNLFCEWGQGFCCMAGLNESQRSVTGLNYYSFEHPIKTDTLNFIISEIRSAGLHNKIIFSFAFPEQIFIPVKIHEAEIVKNIFDTTNTYNDRIAEWQIINQYSIPGIINHAIRETFSSAEFFHVHTSSLKMHSGYDAADQIMVDITPNDFRVLVKSSGKLLLAQVYNYTSPLDVVYYLLKIVSVFNLQKDDLLVILSGLVEENSALYRELHQYFYNLRFSEPALNFDHQLPAHYFTSILNLASCVS